MLRLIARLKRQCVTASTKPQTVALALKSALRLSKKDQIFSASKLSGGEKMPPFKQSKVAVQLSGSRLSKSALNVKQNKRRPP